MDAARLGALRQQVDRAIAVVMNNINNNSDLNSEDNTVNS